MCGPKNFFFTSRHLRIPMPQIKKQCQGYSFTGKKVDFPPLALMSACFTTVECCIILALILQGPSEMLVGFDDKVRPMEKSEHHAVVYRPEKRGSIIDGKLIPYSKLKNTEQVSIPPDGMDVEYHLYFWDIKNINIRYIFNRFRCQKDLIKLFATRSVTICPC